METEILNPAAEPSLNQVSDAESGAEGAHEHVQQATPAGKPEQVAAEPSKLEQLKQKAKDGVAPALDPKGKTPSEATAEEYKANLKFKAAGKDHEVPKLLAQVMKDPESEKFVHALLSKAYGLEMVQTKLQQTREDRQQLHQAYNQVMAPIQEAREAYGRNDLDTVFDKLRIAPQKVLQWAYDRVKLQQMPPEQRQLHEARVSAERRANDLERQQRFGQEAQMEAQSEQIARELELVLERQDYSTLAQEYDQRKGKQGAFRDLVAQCGESEYFRSGKVIPPLEAAKMAADLLGMKAGAPAQKAEAAPAATVPAQQPPAQVEPQKAKITLPNAGGSKAAAPGKSKITSIDGLKKKYDEMRSQG